MILTHIDKEVYIAAYNRYIADPINQSKGFIDFLRKASHLIIYGVEDNIDNKSIDKFNIFTVLLEGAGEVDKPKLINNSFETSIKKINQNNPYQLFFLNIAEKEKQRKISKNINFEVGFINNYYSLYKRLSHEKKIRRGGVINNEIKTFESWHQLFNGISAKNMIISDPYLLHYSDNNPLENNYYSLLEYLSSNYHLDSLIVFTKIDDFKKDYWNIQNKSKRIMGDTFVKIVLFSKESEHDRHIFTDYCRIYFGSSLNSFFNKNNELTEVKRAFSIETFPYVNGDSTNNINHSESILNYLDQILEDFKNSKENFPKIRSKLFYSKLHST